MTIPPDLRVLDLVAQPRFDPPARAAGILVAVDERHGLFRLPLNLGEGCLHEVSVLGMGEVESLPAEHLVRGVTEGVDRSLRVHNGPVRRADHGHVGRPLQKGLEQRLPAPQRLLGASLVSEVDDERRDALGRPVLVAHQRREQPRRHPDPVGTLVDTLVLQHAAGIFLEKLTGPTCRSVPVREGVDVHPDQFLRRAAEKPAHRGVHHDETQVETGDRLR
nr:hypothetical protein [Nocardioides panacis]